LRRLASSPRSIQADYHRRLQREENESTDYEAPPDRTWFQLHKLDKSTRGTGKSSTSLCRARLEHLRFLPVEGPISTMPDCARIAFGNRRRVAFDIAPGPART